MATKFGTDPIDTKGFQTVLSLVENTCSDSFDLSFSACITTMIMPRFCLGICARPWRASRGS